MAGKAKTAAVKVYCTTEQHDALVAEALARGRDLGPWLLELGLEASRTETLDRKVTALDAEVGRLQEEMAELRHSLVT
jgi:hypothetical protein